jgi:hypothetical protein
VDAVELFGCSVERFTERVSMVFCADIARKFSAIEGQLDHRYFGYGG